MRLKKSKQQRFGVLKKLDLNPIVHVGQPAIKGKHIASGPVKHSAAASRRVAARRGLGWLDDHWIGAFLLTHY